MDVNFFVLHSKWIGFEFHNCVLKSWRNWYCMGIERPLSKRNANWIPFLCTYPIYIRCIYVCNICMYIYIYDIWYTYMAFSSHILRMYCCFWATVGRCDVQVGHFHPVLWLSWTHPESTSNKEPHKNWKTCKILRNLQHTPGTYPKPSTTCLWREILSYFYFFCAWGMFQGFVGILLEQYHASRLNFQPPPYPLVCLKRKVDQLLCEFFNLHHPSPESVPV